MENEGPREVPRVSRDAAFPAAVQARGTRSGRCRRANRGRLVRVTRQVRPEVQCRDRAARRARIPSRETPDELPPTLGAYKLSSSRPLHFKTQCTHASGVPSRFLAYRERHTADRDGRNTFDGRSLLHGHVGGFSKYQATIVPTFTGQLSRARLLALGMGLAHDIGEARTVPISRVRCASRKGSRMRGALKLALITMTLLAIAGIGRRRRGQLERRVADEALMTWDDEGGSVAPLHQGNLDGSRIRR
jgi:hypothetical protein